MTSQDDNKEVSSHNTVYSCVFLCILVYSCAVLCIIVYFTSNMTWYNDIIIWCKTHHNDVIKWHHRIFCHPDYVFLCILVYSFVFLCILVFFTSNIRHDKMISSYDVILLITKTSQNNVVRFAYFYLHLFPPHFF